MYLSDEKMFDFLAAIFLLALPWLGTALGLWGWLWEILIIAAIFWIGQRRGLRTVMVLSVVAYGVPLAIYNIYGLEQMGFVPLAALLSILGWQKRWPQRVTFFWSLFLAGLLGALPTLSFVYHGLAPQTIQELIASAVQFYQSSGMLELLKQQGITQAQMNSLLKEILPVYILLIPGLAAISSFVEFGLVYYFVRRWFNRDYQLAAFSRWRLPWYAIWGAILALASYLIGDQFSVTVLKGIGMNLMMVYGAIALVLGASVYLFFLKSPRIPRFIKWGFVLINLFYFFFSLMSLVMFGLFDMVLNFRRLPEIEGKPQA